MAIGKTLQRLANAHRKLFVLQPRQLIGCDAKGLAAIGPAAVALAEAEGLDAHALSVSIRLGR